jgi:glycosyltransferase involved in cell wall biosynthesis
LTPSAPPTLRSLPLRSLFASNARADDQIFFHGLWFRGHSNRRYAQLLPRLRRVDPYLVTCSDRRLLRGVEYRALRATRWARHKLVFGAAARRYRFTFTTDIEQIPFIKTPVVVDLDDPMYTLSDVALLSRPNVMAYVVTTKEAAQAYEDLGLGTPGFVVPQGVDLGSLDAATIADTGAKLRRPGELVIGYVAAFLLTASDRDGQNALYNIDHLLELWEQVRVSVPNARLWLIGEPSDAVKRRLTGRDDVLLTGRLASDEVLTHVANFDIALYPRRRSEERFRSAMKVAEHLGLGIPTVAYDLDQTQMIEAAGAGVLVKDAASFVSAVTHLATDSGARGVMAERAKTAGRDLDWDRLAAAYERDILDPLLRQGVS